MKQYILALLALAGCPSAQLGTIDLELTTAPGSTLMDAVTRLRLTITSPLQVIEAERGSSGFDLVLDVEATGGAGALIVEGFDANGLIAAGQSPVFPVNGIDARIVIYMASPLSVGRAPVALTPERTAVAGVALSFGVLLAGGTDLASAASDALVIYNAYDHTLGSGVALPAPRSGPALGLGANGIVYLFGGRDAAGTPTATLWQFDTNFAPAGRYFELGDHAGFERADQVMVPLGVEHFVITGPSLLELELGNLAELAATPIAPTGAGANVDGIATAILADPSGALLRFREDTLVTLPLALVPGAAIATLPDGRVVVLGGASRDAVIIDAATGAGTRVPDVLLHPRTAPAIAVTPRHVVVVGGGTDQVEILDAGTLARLASRPGPAQGRPIPLANGQVLIVSDPGVLDLFTPPPP